MSATGEYVTTDLGYALEVELDGHVMRWRRGEALAVWNQDKRCIVIVERARHGRRKPIENEADGRLFRRWTGRTARNQREVDVGGGSWEQWGVVKRFDYWSKKWNPRGTEYTHDVTTGPRLYRYGTKTKANAWVVAGGNLTLTARGLIG